MKNSNIGEDAPVWGHFDSRTRVSDGVVEIFLNPGEYFVGGAGFQVRTILGSCVSIILWHQRLRFGAMSHYLLSSRPGTATAPCAAPGNRSLRCSTSSVLGVVPPASMHSSAMPADAFDMAGKLDGKYADEVLVLMIRALHDAKIPLAECQAKIFGGGNMFPGRPVRDQLDIGLKNGEAAKLLLSAYGIPVVSENLFGFGHREIIFNPGNGDVWVRQIRPEF